MDQERILRMALKMYFKEVRDAVGGSQGSFAARMGISQQTVSNIASGAGQVTVEQFAQLAKIQGRSAVSALSHLIEIVENLQRHPGKSPMRLATRTGRIGVSSEESERPPRSANRRERGHDKQPTEEAHDRRSSHKRTPQDEEPGVPPRDDTDPPRR